MNFLNGLNSNVLSIDIGAYEIKVVVGRNSKMGIIIDNYFTIKTPEGSYSDGEIIDKYLLKTKIKEELKKENIKMKTTYLTINSSSIITREVVIPKVQDDEIEKLIKFQLEDYLPRNASLYIIQCKIIDLIYEEDIEKYRLLLIAIPKEVVESHFELLKEINLNPLVLDYQSNSLSKVIKNNEFINDIYPIKDLTFIAADIGYESTKISIIKNGTIQVSRLVDIESRLVDENTIEEFLEKLNNEMEIIFKYYLTRDPNNNIDMILLFGGLVEVEDLSKEFSKHFQIPLIEVELFSDMEFNIKIHKYINAIGSLIRETKVENLNFFESYIKKERKAIKKQVILFTTTISLLSIIFFGFVFNKIKIREIRKELEKFKIVAENPNVNKKVDKIMQKEKNLKKFKENLLKTKKIDEKIEEARIIDGDLLNTITSKMPSGVFFTSLDMSLNSIELIGIAEDEDSIAIFSEELKAILIFEDIFISNISKIDGNCNFVCNILLKDVGIGEESKFFEEDEEFDEFYEDDEFDEK